MRFRSKRLAGIGALVAGACFVASMTTGFVPMSGDDINAHSAVAAVKRVAPDAVGDVASSTSSQTDAVSVSKAGASVSVSRKARQGVRVAGGVTVGLPFADRASDAVTTGGVAVFNNNNGSSTVPVVHTDGTLQISTVITDASAPHAYDYPLGLAMGQTLQATADGGAVVTDGRATLLSIAAPWAKDANGNPVATHYEIHGNTLTQVVDFTPTTAFPVTADPSVSYCTVGGWYPAECVKFSKSETLAAAQVYWAGAAAGVAIERICSKIPVAGIKTACTLAGLGAVAINVGAISTAASQGKCVSIKFTYPFIAQIFAGGFTVVRC